MPLEKEPQKIPAEIGHVTARFTVLSGSSTGIDTAMLDFDVLDISGNIIRTRSHPLLEHMTAAQKTAVFNFLTQIRTKAKAEAV